MLDGWIQYMTLTLKKRIHQFDGESFPKQQQQQQQISI